MDGLHHAGLRVQARNLVKRFTTRAGTNYALNDVSIDIRPGAMVVLLGPSGCGKTTLLRCIAGLEQPEVGEISLDGRLVYSATRQLWIPPERRRISMVFQSYALWPHMNVFENIAYPLRSRRQEKTDLRQRVERVMEMVGLAALAERLPAQLSGGQQQRVALARAIAAESSVILFDEPLSNVDAKVRDQIRREIVRLQRQFGFAGLYVTHDQLEAGALADTLVVMDHGRIAQSGTPGEVYDAPSTRYVATFMGTVNEFTGTVREHHSGGRVALETRLGPIVGTARGDRAALTQDAVALFRSEACVLGPALPEGPNVWPCEVQRGMFLGPSIELLLQVMIKGEPIQITALAARSEYPATARLYLHIPPDSVWVFAP